MKLLLADRLVSLCVIATVAVGGRDTPEETGKKSCF